MTTDNRADVLALADDEIAAIGRDCGLDVLTEILNDDQWNNVEPKLLTFARAIAARALSRPVPEGWVAAVDAPREWEGKLAWVYHRITGEIKQNVVPPNYSRQPNHCAGVFFIPIQVPAAPAEREDR